MVICPVSIPRSHCSTMKTSCMAVDRTAQAESQADACWRYRFFFFFFFFFAKKREDCYTGWRQTPSQLVKKWDRAVVGHGWVRAWSSLLKVAQSFSQKCGDFFCWNHHFSYADNGHKKLCGVMDGILHQSRVENWHSNEKIAEKILVFLFKGLKARWMDALSLFFFLLAWGSPLK